MTDVLAGPRELARAGFSAAVEPRWIERASRQMCPGCAADRAVDVLVIISEHASAAIAQARSRARPFVDATPPPSRSSRTAGARRPEGSPFATVAKVVCRDCGTGWLAAHVSPRRGDLEGSLEFVGRPPAVLHTARTPDSVKPYLEEAAKCVAAGAHLAALGMFRAALDAILTQQGFDQRMLGPKIGALEQAMAQGEAPPWSRHLDTRRMKLLKNIGNSALHDSSAPPTLSDPALVDAAQALVTVLLDAIYDQPVRQDAHDAALRAALDQLKL